MACCDFLFGWLVRFVGGIRNFQNYKGLYCSEKNSVFATYLQRQLVQKSSELDLDKMGLFSLLDLLFCFCFLLGRLRTYNLMKERSVQFYESET